MTNAFPYRLFSEMQKAAFRESLQEVLGAWVKAWFSSAPKVDVSLFEPDEVPLSKGDWLILGDIPELWLAWKLDAAIAHDLVGMMFNASVGRADKTSPLMRGLLKECITGLAHDFFTANKIQVNTEIIRTESLDSLRTGRGSGVLVVELQGAFSRQQIAFGGAVVERTIPALDVPAHFIPSIDDRESAIGNYVASLEIAIGTAELTLKDLANINVGDVIKLNTSVKESLVVRTSEGVTIANAHLGTFGNRKAIQFID